MDSLTIPWTSVIRGENGEESRLGRQTLDRLLTVAIKQAKGTRIVSNQQDDNKAWRTILLGQFSVPAQ